MSSSHQTRLRLSDELVEALAPMLPALIRAYGRPVTLEEAFAWAALIGARAARRCLTCAAGAKCEAHPLAPRGPARGRKPAAVAAEADPGPEPVAPEEGQRWAGKVWCTRCRPAADALPGTWHAEHAEVLCFYAREYERVRGAPPSLGSHQGAAVKRLLASVGRERAIAAIRGAYNDPFWAGAGHATIITIARDPDRHLGAPATARRTSTRQQAPATGRTWKRGEGVEA